MSWGSGMPPNGPNGLNNPNGPNAANCWYSDTPNFNNNNFGPYGYPSGQGFNSGPPRHQGPGMSSGPGMMPPMTPPNQWGGQMQQYGNYGYPNGNFSWGGPVMPQTPPNAPKNSLNDDKKSCPPVPTDAIKGCPPPLPLTDDILPPLPPGDPPTLPNEPKPESASKPSEQKPDKETTKSDVSSNLISSTPSATLPKPPPLPSEDPPPTPQPNILANLTAPPPPPSTPPPNMAAHPPPSNMPPNMNGPPPPYFGGQYNVPPPNNYSNMYPQNNWFNHQRFPNSGNFQGNNMDSGNMNFPNHSSQDANSSPIKFAIDGKKPYMPNSMNSPVLNEASGQNLQEDFPQGFNSKASKKKKKKQAAWLKKEAAFENQGRQQMNIGKAVPFVVAKENHMAVTTPKKDNSSLLASGDWPDSLKAYVGRCFARCRTELDKDQVEICLKGKLTQAAHNESLLSKDWDHEPLISVHSAPDPPTDGDGDGDKWSRDGDPSRGFVIVKRPRSKSRSSSPGDVRRQDRRGGDQNVGFIGFAPPPKGDAAFGPSRRGRRGRKGRGKFNKGGNCMTLDEEMCTDDRLQKRAARFCNQRGGGTPSKRKRLEAKGIAGRLDLRATLTSAFENKGGDVDGGWGDERRMVGTSTALTKDYLRLTTAPDPSTVRTVATLHRSLAHVQQDWAQKQEYRYACNQLKAIRQDLTVQGIRDQFTIQVYETHCRVALERGDHEEFNQCQTQLAALYKEVDEGELEAGEEGDSHRHRLEFVSYRILYYIYTQNTLDMTSLMASLSASDQASPCVSWALRLRAAWALGNFCRMFALYRDAPNMAAFLVEWFASRERMKAIRTIVKSYRPGLVPCDFVRRSLAITAKDWDAFVEEAKLVFTSGDKTQIDCKSSFAAMTGGAN